MVDGPVLGAAWVPALQPMPGAVRDGCRSALDQAPGVEQLSAWRHVGQLPHGLIRERRTCKVWVAISTRSAVTWRR